MVVAALVAGLVVLGVQPFDLDETGEVVGTSAAVLLVLGLAAIAFAKGRILLGTLSLFVPLAGAVAACRLAKPGSPWARWRYRGERARRLARAHERYAGDRRAERLGVRVRDAIGGAPSPPAEEPEVATAPARRSTRAATRRRRSRGRPRAARRSRAGRARRRRGSPRRSPSRSPAARLNGLSTSSDSGAHGEVEDLEAVVLEHRDLADARVVREAHHLLGGDLARVDGDVDAAALVDLDRRRGRARARSSCRTPWRLGEDRAVEVAARRR